MKPVIEKPPALRFEWSLLNRSGEKHGKRLVVGKYGRVTMKHPAIVGDQNQVMLFDKGDDFRITCVMGEVGVMVNRCHADLAQYMDQLR